MPTVGDYLKLITSEHSDKPNYIATVTALLQPFTDSQNVLAAMPEGYDVDVAVGVQLDAVGLWVGVSRFLTVPLADVWFSFDTLGLGFDEGSWFGPGSKTTGITRLDDEPYRTLIYARIANNQWTGNVPDAYLFLDKVFPDNIPIIQDNQDMSMDYGFAGPPITDPVKLALLYGGYLDVKPAGVRIRNYISPSVAGPLFGFDIENSTVSGFDVGGWATLTPGDR